MAWYNVVVQRSLWYNTEYLTCHLHFPEMQVTSDKLLHTLAKGSGVCLPWKYKGYSSVYHSKALHNWCVFILVLYSNSIIFFWEICNVDLSAFCCSLKEKDSLGDVATFLSFDLEFGLVKSCGGDLCPMLNASLDTKHTAKVRHEGYCTMDHLK